MYPRVGHPQDQEELVPESDAMLTQRVALGSERALEVLYDRHAPSVFRVAWAIGRDQPMAEEVVQETFLALWNRAELFDPDQGSVATWLSAIARNRAIDRLRSMARRPSPVPFSVVVGDHPDEAGTVEWLAASASVVASAEPERGPEPRVIASEDREAVVQAIGTLTDDERETILLAYRDGLSQSEIAARLGWPLGTVKTRSRRALRRLRAALEARDEDACCADEVPA